MLGVSNAGVSMDGLVEIARAVNNGDLENFTKAFKEAEKGYADAKIADDARKKELAELEKSNESQRKELDLVIANAQALETEILGKKSSLEAERDEFNAFQEREQRRLANASSAQEERNERLERWNSELKTLEAGLKKQEADAGKLKQQWEAAVAALRGAGVNIEAVK